MGGFGFNFNPLFAFFQSILNFIVSALIFLFNLIVEVLVFLVNVIIQLINIVWKGLRALGKLLRPIYEKVLRPFLRILRVVFNKIQIILFSVLRPALLAIQCVNQALDFFYRNVMRPIQQIFFVLRSWLRVLRIFAPKLARRLDRRLARVEQKIFGGFFRIRGLVNQVATFINRLVTFDGLLQRNTLWRSILRDLDLLYAIFFGGKLTGLSLDEHRRLSDLLFRDQLDDAIRQIERTRRPIRQRLPGDILNEITEGLQ